MTENRIPLQISDNRVLCNDGTIWSWSKGDLMAGIMSGWQKMPPIPTDEEYEDFKRKQKEINDRWYEAQLERMNKGILKNDR